MPKPITPKALAQFDEASAHPYECRCEICLKWWQIMGSEPDDNYASNGEPQVREEWNVTDDEFQTALKRECADDTPLEDSRAYWQLVRYYRGQIYDREQAARALAWIRARP